MKSTNISWYHCVNQMSIYQFMNNEFTNTLVWKQVRDTFLEFVKTFFWHIWDLYRFLRCTIWGFGTCWVQASRICKPQWCSGSKTSWPKVFYSNFYVGVGGYLPQTNSVQFVLLFFFTFPHCTVIQNSSCTPLRHKKLSHFSSYFISQIWSTGIFWFS